MKSSVVLVGLFCAISVWSGFQTPSQKKVAPKHTKPSAVTENATKENQEQSVKKTSQNEGENVKVLSVPEILTESKKDSYDKILVIATILLVVVGVFQIVYLWRTVQVARDSAEIAKASTEALTRAERSWLLVKRVGNPPENWLALVPSQGYAPGIVLEFGVFGRTVVTVTDARFVLHPVPAKDGIMPPEPALPEPPDYRGATTNLNVQNGNILPPGGTMTIKEYLHGLTQLNLAELRDRKMILCAYGFVEYDDAFGNHRETATCYVYDFAWGGVFKSPDGTVLNPAGFYIGGPKTYHRAT